MFRASTIALISALSLSTNALAGPFEDATAALVRGDYSSAQQILLPLAEQGNPQAQLAIARMFLGGTGVQQNDRTAGEWVRKAADQGNADAQNLAGYMYESGRCLTADIAEAIKGYRKSAENGFASAQNNLGFASQTGRGVAKDWAEA